MINNNWEEEFYKLKMTGIGEWHGSADYWTIVGFIKNLLTKKDQEHKAELEMIRKVFWETYNKNSDYYSESIEKGDMDNSNESAYTTAVLNQIIKSLRDNGIELEDTTAILDSHINKLSTE